MAGRKSDESNSLQGATQRWSFRKLHTWLTRCWTTARQAVSFRFQLMICDLGGWSGRDRPFPGCREWAALYPASRGWLRNARVESAILVLIGNQLALARDDDSPRRSHERYPTHVRNPMDASREQTSRINLLTFAGHVIVPVHKCSVGVVPPGPNVQFEKRRYAVAVWAAHE
jgi:hypothetical protein